MTKSVLLCLIDLPFGVLQEVGHADNIIWTARENVRNGIEPGGQRGRPRHVRPPPPMTWSGQPEEPATVNCEWSIYADCQ